MHDDQFTAMGPPFAGSGFPEAGFSTVEDGDGFQFGVRANALRCGVVGQTRGGGISGVLGQGSFSQFGVMGTAFGESRIGVVGVSVSTTNDLFNLNVPPGSFNLNSLGRGHGTGVLGKSTTGFGTHGISTSNTAVVGQIVRGGGLNPPAPTGFGVHGIAITNTAVVGNSETGFGVHGISESNTGVVGNSDGDGFGVHGIAKTRTGVVGESAKGIGVHGISRAAEDGVRGSSTNGNGGLFESMNGAQIRLVPRVMVSPERSMAGAGHTELLRDCHHIYSEHIVTDPGVPSSRPPKLFNKLLGQLYHCLQHKQTFDGTSATLRGPRRVPRGMNPAARSSPSGPSELTGSHDSGVRIRRGMTALA